MAGSPAGTIRLDPGQAKNEEGQVVYLPADLKVLVAAQVRQVRALERKLGRMIPHLFPHLRGRHRGKRIKDFSRAWQGPAGAQRSGRCWHDFRRTTVRNLVHSDLSEKYSENRIGVVVQPG